MPLETVTTFFALLAVLALVVVVVAVVTAASRAVRRVTPRWAIATRGAVAPVALPLATAVALTTSLGSLYLSEVAEFPPCILCWYQRIAMYPLAVILIVASLRRDRAVWLRRAARRASVSASRSTTTWSSGFPTR